MRIRLSFPLTTEYIAKKMGAVSLNAAPDTQIEYVSTDTRELCSGDLFIALKGKSFDGENFLDEAANLGAYTVSTSETSHIRVTDTEIALLTLASAYKRKFPLREIIAITGSNGKTTTREITESVFRASGLKFHSTEHNYNNILGVAFTLLSLKRDTEYLLLECGMNKKGELRRISNAVNPTLSVITNIGSSHLYELKSRRGIASAKLEILSGMTKSQVIIPENEPLLAHIKEKLTLSVNSNKGDFAIFSRELPDDGTEYTFLYSGRSLKKIKSALPFYHIKEALGFALCIFCRCRASGSQIPDFKLADRLLHTEIIKKCGITLLDDSYNSSIESIEYGIITLFRIKAKRHILLLSDTHETNNPEKYHKNIGSLIATLKPDLVLLYGKYQNFIIEGALGGGYPEGKILPLTETYSEHTVVRELLPKLSLGDAILIKGSHGTNAHKISALI